MMRYFNAMQVIAKAKGVDWRSVRKFAQVQEKLDATLEKMYDYFCFFVLVFIKQNCPPHFILRLGEANAHAQKFAH
jgi:hypothetical protein